VNARGLWEYSQIVGPIWLALATGELDGDGVVGTVTDVQVMAMLFNRRHFNLWKSRSRQCKRRTTRRRLGQILEPRIMLAADADLAITASAPISAVMGETIPVSWTVQNQGTGPANSNWFDRVYLSTDDTFDNADRLLTSRSAQYETPLTAGDTYTAQRNLAIPSTTIGEQFLLFITDTTEVQEETDEQNNTVAVAIDITAPDVDLTVTSVSSPATAVASEPISISWTVQNGGSELTNSQPWQDWVYLSEDSILDEQDLRIGTSFVDSFLPVEPGQSYSPTLELFSLNSNWAVYLSRSGRFGIPRRNGRYEQCHRRADQHRCTQPVHRTGQRTDDSGIRRDDHGLVPGDQHRHGSGLRVLARSSLFFRG